MLGTFFTTVLIEPIYNAFVFLIDIVPGHDTGLAIIALTIVIRLIFLPAFSQALRTQHGMRRVEPELDAIKEKYKDDKQEQAKRTMALFKERGIKPFATFFSLLIQLPVFIALYAVFLREGLPGARAAPLVFVYAHARERRDLLLGFLDLTLTKNILLALVVAGVQFFQSRLSLGAMKPVDMKNPQKAQTALIQRQMLYLIPIIMGVVTYTAPAAAGLYLLTNAVISVIQELVVRRSIDAKFDALARTEKSAA